MSKPEILKAPVGEARWAHVPKPNTRFNKDGVYSIDLVVPADEAAELIQQLEEAHQNNLVEIKRNPKLKIKKIKENDLYTQDLDDEENETGHIVFKFKRDATYQPTDAEGNPKGPRRRVTVPLFDAKGKRLNEDIEIGNGSKVKVAYSLSPYYVASIGAGVSLRLQAIQIIDLKARSGGANADYYGFEEEDGYEIGEDSEETSSEEASQADDAGDF